MRSLGRHLNYANIVATLALVFAMGGSAGDPENGLNTSTGKLGFSLVWLSTKSPGSIEADEGTYTVTAPK